MTRRTENHPCFPQDFSKEPMKPQFPFLHMLLAALALVFLHSRAQADDLVIPGSGNAEYVLGQLAAAFNKQQSQHRVMVPPSTGTAGALRDVEANTVVLGRVGRPLKDEERARGLVYLPLARDPVVFAGGAGVTARNITPAQVMSIYRGTLTDWRDLGGMPGPIRAIGRETTDAARQAVGRTIKQFDTLEFADNVKLVHLDPQLIDLLDRFPGSLGFLNRSALAASKTRLVYLSLDGAEPTATDVATGKYPLWLEFGLVHKAGGLAGGIRQFVDFVYSATGQRILRDHGVLPVTLAR